MSLLNHVNEAFTSEIEAKEGGSKEYKKYFADKLKKSGYDSIADIPKDKKDDFFNDVDKGWKGNDEGSNENLNNKLEMNTENTSEAYIEDMPVMNEKDKTLVNLLKKNKVTLKVTGTSGPMKVKVAKLSGSKDGIIAVLNGAWADDEEDEDDRYAKHIVETKSKYEGSNENLNAKLTIKESKSLFESVQNAFDDESIDEATDWGTREISSENDLIKLVAKLAKKSKTIVSKINKELKGAKLTTEGDYCDDDDESIDEATDWGTREISSENDLIKLVAKLAKKSKTIVSKINKEIGSNKLVVKALNENFTKENNTVQIGEGLDYGARLSDMIERKNDFVAKITVDKEYGDLCDACQAATKIGTRISKYKVGFKSIEDYEDFVDELLEKDVPEKAIYREVM